MKPVHASGEKWAAGYGQAAAPQISECDQFDTGCVKVW